MPGNPFTDPNWAPDVVNEIERLVGTVRSTATDRAVTVVRGLVFGIIIGIAALIAFALLIILSTKLLQTILEGVTDTDSSVWLSYVIMSVVLFALGALAMRMRRPKGATL
jgi:Sec-independent protein secretion pathway component TatC